MIRKAVVVLIRGRGIQNLMETKYEANNLHKIFHIMYNASVKRSEFNKFAKISIL